MTNAGIKGLAPEIGIDRGTLVLVDARRIVDGLRAVYREDEAEAVLRNARARLLTEEEMEVLRRVAVSVGISTKHLATEIGTHPTAMANRCAALKEKRALVSIKNGRNLIWHATDLGRSIVARDGGTEPEAVKP